MTEEWLATQCDKLCAKAAAVPSSARSKFIDGQIQLLPVSDVLKLALQNMMSVKELAIRESISVWEKIAALVFGTASIITILVLAIEFPTPTPFQFFVFRVVLSLAAAGVGSVMTGFLSVVVGNIEKPWLRAGGGLAVFVVVYLVNPAKLFIAETLTKHI